MLKKVINSRFLKKILFYLAIYTLEDSVLFRFFQKKIQILLLFFVDKIKNNFAGCRFLCIFALSFEREIVTNSNSTNYE